MTRTEIITTWRAADEAFRASYDAFALIRDGFSKGEISAADFIAARQRHEAVHAAYEIAADRVAELPEDDQLELMDAGVVMAPEACQIEMF